MSVVGDFTVSAPTFGLAESLEAAPSLTVELDRLVAHSRKWIMPFLWVSGPESKFDQFDAAVASDPSVQRFDVTDRFPDSRLYKMTWNLEVARTVDTVLDHEGVILEATGQGEKWQLKVRFADRERLAEFHSHFRTNGDVVLEQLFSPTEPHGGAFNLTTKQRDALVAAYEGGYYEAPREATATELADDFGLSQQAFSERLHRGTSKLIENTLLTG
ncbi:hypothetical protein SAMN05444422_1283 [Halobiforma haloterrestris]|uniref:HTH DNA binding domain-containing protein n=1 Tax=Natronobacterium haloterrestre TaxID=148448 RepID=A0A1I1LW06_NATHA|nr:helix-turn-helix domain-containing protein [Halobiforma haloterrestris]SFC77407.1 hypothetical protein SAMN05444422_1283 [Halobiforma haloterrestris]